MLSERSNDNSSESISAGDPVGSDEYLEVEN